MTKKVADIGGKRLVSLAPDAWAKWGTQNPEVKATETCIQQVYQPRK